MDQFVKDGKRIHFHNSLTITEQFLNDNPDCYFIFGDNSRHYGHGGAAKLRDLANSIGFVTKKVPSNDPNSFYTLKEYLPVFEEEKKRLIKCIEENPDKWFLISKLGSGLANKHKIFENMIGPWLEGLFIYDNVILLY